jgi:hypothetical protein
MHPTAAPSHQSTLYLFTAEPTLNPYSKKLHRKAIPFTGGSINSRSLERFILKSIPDLVKKADSELSYEDIKGESTKPLLMVFSEKTGVSNLFKLICFKARSLVQCVHVHQFAYNLVEAFDVEKWPTIIHVDGEKKSVFDGTEQDQVKIVEWAASLAPADTGSSGSGDSASSGEEGASRKGAQRPAAKSQGTVFSDKDAFSEAVLGSGVAPGGRSGGAGADAEHIAYLVAVARSDASAELGDWAKAQRNCDGMVRAVELRCGESSEGSSLGHRLCADGATTPFYFVLPSGNGARAKAATPAAMKKWRFKANEVASAVIRAQESLPESAVTSVYESDLDYFLQANVHKRRISMIVLSDKTNPPVFMRNVALSFRDHAALAFMSAPSDETLARFGNPVLPTIISLHAEMPTGEEKSGEASMGFQVQGYPQDIFGPLKSKSMMTFVAQMIHSYGMTGVDGEASADDSGTSGSAGPAKITAVKSQSGWETACSEDFKGICVIGFAAGDDDSGSEFRKAADALSGSAVFKFLSVDASCQAGFADAFNVQQEKVPAVAAYSPFKSRYGTHSGAYEASSIKDWLNRVGSGRASTGPLQERPVIAAECDGGVVDAADAIDSIEDADDMLAEIRREEEEAAAALEKELQDEKEAREREEREAEEAAKKKKNKKKKKKGKKKAKSEL